MKQKMHRRRNLSVRVSLRDMLRLIRVDTLRGVDNVGFIVERRIYVSISQINSVMTWVTYITVTF